MHFTPFFAIAGTLAVAVSGYPSGPANNSSILPALESLHQPLDLAWPPARVEEPAEGRYTQCAPPKPGAKRTEFPVSILKYEFAVKDVSAGDVFMQVVNFNETSINKRFETIVEGLKVGAKKPGYRCVSAPHQFHRFKAGTELTIELSYRSNQAVPGNKTEKSEVGKPRYACADIVLVDDGKVKESAMCPHAGEPNSSSSADDKSTGLSKGAIIGIVVGVIAVLAIAISGGLFMMKRRRQ